MEPVSARVPGGPEVSERLRNSAGGVRPAGAGVRGGNLHRKSEYHQALRRAECERERGGKAKVGCALSIRGRPEAWGRQLVLTGDIFTPRVVCRRGGKRGEAGREGLMMGVVYNAWHVDLKQHLYMQGQPPEHQVGNRWPRVSSCPPSMRFEALTTRPGTSGTVLKVAINFYTRGARLRRALSHSLACRGRIRASLSVRMSARPSRVRE